MLTDAELEQLVALGVEHDTEVVLLTGPRASWDVGAQARTTVQAAALRGNDQLAFGIEYVLRAADHGVTGVLVADLGQLAVLGRMKTQGPDFLLKVSISLPVGNAATARVLEDLGATSLNLTVDVYVGAGDTVRHYEVADLVRVAAPIYLKYTVRNAAGSHPSGRHLDPLVRALSGERVRRLDFGLLVLRRYFPEAMPSGVAPQATVRGAG